MRECTNISDIAALKPDFMGFIFYPKSPRHVGLLDVERVSFVKSLGIEPVAVFVNASLVSMIQTVDLYDFTHIQLHGNETPEVCRALKEKGVKVLKAFSIADPSDLEGVHVFDPCCDYFLFDTKTSVPGGSGCKFDWNILNAYTGTTPFFLSGGIGPNDVEQIRNVHHPLFFGIDVNSRFETQPAQKDAALLKKFIDQFIPKNQESDAK